MAIATTLYSKQGALAPRTIASQVEVADSTGAPSNVSAEISAIRKLIENVASGGVRVSTQTETVENEIASGQSYSVPEYSMGSGKLSVFIDGILCSVGVEYYEETSTSIYFTSEIPAGIELTIKVIS